LKRMEQNKLMFNKWLYRRLPYVIRRRLTPQQSPFVVVVLLAATVIILQCVSFLFNEDKVSDKIVQEKVQQQQPPPPRQRRPLGNVIGVKPNLKMQYVPDADNLFKCLSTKSKKIPFDWVNDDYCDCEEDGSDEPATGACQNSKFYCTKNDSSRKGPEWILANRVNDGICDCCDGSDEWKLNQPLGKAILPHQTQEKLHRYQTPCQNTCS